MNNNNYRVVSLFAGIGGICLGFKQAGFEIVWANEFDSAACRTYRHNFGNNYLTEADICRVKTESIPDFDVLVGGFPCQPFSIAGRQKGFDDKRGNLFFEITRIMDAKRPKVVFLENVPNLMEHDDGKTFLVIYNSLVQFGYSIYYKIMGADEYGNLPQIRKRIYIVAVRDDIVNKSYHHPDPVELTCSIDDIVKKNDRKKDIYYYSNNSKMFGYLKANMADKSSIYRIVDAGVRKTKNRMCPTLIANMGTYPDRVPVVWDDYGIRKLTLRECLDFQGFPQDFYFPNTITVDDAYKQIGNSVCVPVIKRIAEQIKWVLEEGGQ